MFSCFIKFQLVFDNYTPSSAPSNVSPSSSRSRRTLADATPVEDSLPRELDELRQQLQYAKKQTLVMMEQSRKSSEAEKIALQQAHESVAAKEIAASEAERERLEALLYEYAPEEEEVAPAPRLPLPTEQRNTSTPLPPEIKLPPGIRPDDL